MMYGTRMSRSWAWLTTHPLFALKTHVLHHIRVRCLSTGVDYPNMVNVRALLDPVGMDAGQAGRRVRRSSQTRAERASASTWCWSGCTAWLRCACWGAREGGAVGVGEPMDSAAAEQERARMVRDFFAGSFVPQPEDEGEGGGRPKSNGRGGGAVRFLLCSTATAPTGRLRTRRRRTSPA